MTDEIVLDTIREMVRKHGQVNTGKMLGVARSLLSMVLAGKTPVSAKLRERVDAYLLQGAVSSLGYGEWQRPSDELASFVEVSVDFRFTWLALDEAQKLADAVANFAFLYISEYAERKLSQEESDFILGTPNCPAKPTFPADG